MIRHTRKWKEAQLQELKELADKYPVVAIADLHNFPANLFADVRKKLSENAVVRVSKTRVLRRALSESSKKEIAEKANRSVAVIFTDMDPFKLYAYLKKNKGRAAAKQGQIAPSDIMIPAGDTGLPPGPALSDLKAAGLPVRVQGPTIHISKDTVVVEKGKPITKAVTSVLSKLDIKPIEIGLNVVAVLEEGLIYGSDVLDVDIEELFSKFVAAHRNSFLLSLEIGYLTKETLPLLIQKAVREANALAFEAEIYTEDTLPVFLARAEAAAKSIKSKVKVPGTVPPTGKKEEQKAEEKKPEAKEEKPKEKAAEKKEKPGEVKKEKKPAAKKKEPTKEGKKKPAKGKKKK